MNELNLGEEIGMLSPENKEVLQSIVESVPQFEEKEVTRYATIVYNNIKSTAKKISEKHGGNKAEYDAYERRRTRQSDRIKNMKQYATENYPAILAKVFPASREISVESLPTESELHSILSVEDVYRCVVTDEEKNEASQEVSRRVPVQSKKRKRFRSNKPDFLKNYRIVEEIMDHLEENEARNKKYPRDDHEVEAPLPDQDGLRKLARFSSSNQQ